MLSDAWFDEVTDRLNGLRDQYRNADPFPHIIMSDFFPDDFAEQVAQDLEQPPKRGDAWQQFKNENENKRATKPGRAFVGQPESVRAALTALNDERLVRALGAVSDASDLVADPNYIGGGVHRIQRGGHLGIHVDFNRLPKSSLFRRLNLLVYMNRDWSEDWGGHLELWKQDRSACAHRVSPKKNVAVLFSTGQKSWHGHPEPLKCPKNRARLSLATYYYASEPGDQRRRPHTTRFMNNII